MRRENSKDYRFNFFVNTMDGAFFGLALGFASFLTIIPLFLNRLTSSAILIGLVPAIHSVGWQLPQLFIAHRVSKMRRCLPMVLQMTIHERLPFLGMAIIAWFLPSIGPKIALVLTFAMLIWQGLGGGFSATPWQSMIGKIIPARDRGFFFGFQAAAMNLLLSVSAIAAGFLLQSDDSPRGFALCFFLASLALIVSYIFIALTREPESPPSAEETSQNAFWKASWAILRRDRNFRWFLVVRLLSQLSVMAFSFYTVYAVRSHNMSDAVAGLMMGVFTVGQIIANPIMGRLGDRWSHPSVMKIGALAASSSALVAWLAPGLAWFALVYVLAGLANVAIWTIGLAIILEFGAESERPVYIGLSNTLIAPVTILAPILGGWLADTVGFGVTFLLSAVCGLLTALVLHTLLRDPRHIEIGDRQLEAMD